jgi:hypothetical protein
MSAILLSNRNSASWRGSVSCIAKVGRSWSFCRCW